MALSLNMLDHPISGPDLKCQNQKKNKNAQIIPKPDRSTVFEWLDQEQWGSKIQTFEIWNHSDSGLFDVQISNRAT